ncbi:toll-like receptor 13 [Strongylocentrotus purpuratus]|uniref:TIR domain-containing protein n=1 Tax=Strongylocentrotus purpuratus TaxID=7668 RepID=A0A7M7NCQ8_STRPU|nr:toll-like receptor 13 [Strongylocentrotus purpuratus]
MVKKMKPEHSEREFLMIFPGSTKSQAHALALSVVVCNIVSEPRLCRIYGLVHPIDSVLKLLSLTEAGRPKPELGSALDFAELCHLMFQSKRMASLTILFSLLVFIPQVISRRDEMMTTTPGNESASLRVASALTSGMCDYDVTEKKAYCRNKGLASVPGDLPSDTLRLDLSLNYIRNLQNGSFIRYTLLFFLDLSRNDITTIEPEAFKPLQKLVILDLSNNPSLASGDAFEWLQQLKLLVLDGCNFTSVPDGSLRSSPNLRSLDMAYNRLTSITITSCSDLVAPDFNFGYNGITKLTPETFVILCPMDTIVITDPIQFIDPAAIAPLQAQNLIVGALPMAIEVLTQLFHGVAISGIKGLSAIGSGLTTIPPNFFSPLSNAPLSFLDLSFNEINPLNHSMFSNLTNLYKLILSSNDIRAIEPEYFAESPLLTTLTLTDNDLTTFNYSTFKVIKSTLSAIELVNNPIVCSCEIAWLVDWLSGPVRVIHADQTYCSSASLDPLKQKPLLTFQPEKYCSPNIMLISLLVLACIGVIVLFLICYRNRWALRNKLFLLKLAVLGYDEIEDVRGHSEFAFDLNVMCDDDDDEWLRAHLKPALEERLPDFDRNVFGDEDLIIGMHYLDAIHYVVEKSYKTILLVSRNAVRNNWFLVKFRTALDHVNDYQLENMVVIFLEDIPDEELPFLVRLFLSDHGTYLTWTEDAEEQEYFWTKFVKLLKVNRKTNHVIPPE